MVRANLTYTKWIPQIHWSEDLKAIISQSSTLLFRQNKERIVKNNDSMRWIWITAAALERHLIFFALLYTLQRFFLKENSEWGQLKKKYHCCWVECRQFLSGFFSMKNEQRIKSKTWRHWPVKSTVFCCNVMSLFLKQM